MSLTDLNCKRAKSKDKSYKMFDSNGLYLEVMPNGSKLWRLKYRFQKKEKRLSLGPYPVIGLAEARLGRDAARKSLINNIDPSDIRRDGKRQAIRDANNTFKAIALEWHEKQKERLSENYFNEILHSLGKDVFPSIGKDQVDKLEAPDILKLLRRIEDRGAFDIARRCRQLIGQVFRYGIQTGRCKHNPTRDLQGALINRKRKHFAAIEPSEIPELLIALENNDARLFGRTRRAIKLSLLTFVRPTELRKACWSEIDFEKKEWLIPAARMKSRQDHLVPLSKQALEILQLQREEIGHLGTDFVFPSRSKPLEPMSENTIRVALINMGFEKRMTAHGFRALARTAIREELEYDPDVIEVQLAHKPAGPLGAAYDRSKFLKKRKEMMQEWADYLENISLQKEAEVK